MSPAPQLLQVPAPVESVSKDSAAIFWQIIGYSLVAIVIYLLLEKNIANTLGGAGNLVGRAAKAWVDPIDPLAAISSSTSSGTPAAVGGPAMSQLPPAPSSIANEPISKLGASAKNNAFFKLYREKVDHQPSVTNHA